MLDKKQARIYLRATRKDLGAQLTELRKEKGLTIEELSSEIEFGSHYIELIELGAFDIRISTLHTLSRFFEKKIKIELVD